jgi:uncharacterized SAM-binding protein YcdF (DUF218 family)
MNADADSAGARTEQTVRRRRRLGLVILLLLLLAVAITLRKPLLRGLGWALVVEDAVGTADIIVVATDAGGAGVLEAADLVHAGVAPRVAVFADPPDAVDREFLRRGVPYEDIAARSTRQLKSLGVSIVELIPRSVAGSEDESRVLPGWCDQQRLASIVLVSTADHSRRLRRLLRRSMEGHQTRIALRPSRYSTFDPDRWWESREGIRIEITELQKLLLDVLLHPLS